MKLFSVLISFSVCRRCVHEPFSNNWWFENILKLHCFIKWLYPRNIPSFFDPVWTYILKLKFTPKMNAWGHKSSNNGATKYKPKSSIIQENSMFKDEDPSRYEKDAEEGRGEHYNRQKRRSRYICGELHIHCIIDNLTSYPSLSWKNLSFFIFTKWFMIVLVLFSLMASWYLSQN